ncbi:uncharacterized protein LOC129196037 [Grus americana]|uniref:uncharacterized protein LOC129196037 n=1 Tax=Grus americana TaxID=9117 RepID=UPI002407FEBB|nr:uncharacterized protein LOC129196037 [Grus americana]
MAPQSAFLGEKALLPQRLQLRFRKPWRLLQGALAGRKGAAPRGGGAFGGEPNLSATGQEFGEQSPTTCPVSAVQRKVPDGEEEVRAEYAHGPRSPWLGGSVCVCQRQGEGSCLDRGTCAAGAGAAMLAEAVKEDLRMLRERLAQCSAESVRHKELLRCLGKKQQELREAMEELRRENCDVARCFRNNRQELQELEGLVAQTKEHFQMENGEAGVSVEEAQKAAEALGTDGGASRDSLQSSTQMANRKELLQHMEEIHQDLHHTIEKFSSEGDKHYARMKAWLQADKQENEALRQEIKKLEEALEQEETCQRQSKEEAEAPGTVLPEAMEAQLERDMLVRRGGFMYWLQILCLFLVSLQLAAGFALVAVVLYASWCDPELFYHLLSRVLSQENYTALAYALGKILPVASEGLLPF